MGLPDTAFNGEQSLPSRDKKPDMQSRQPVSPPSLRPTNLVKDKIATAQTLDTTSLQTSKHHPDFRTRNQLKTLKLATMLSDLQLHLSAAQHSQNQSALDDLLARLMKAAEGLSNLAQPVPTKQSDSATRKLDGGDLSDVCKSMNGSGWYRVKHKSREVREASIENRVDDETLG